MDGNGELLVHRENGQAQDVPGQGQAQGVPGQGQAVEVPGQGQAREVPGQGQAAVAPGQGQAAAAPGQGGEAAVNALIAQLFEDRTLLVGMAQRLADQPRDQWVQREPAVQRAEPVRVKPPTFDGEGDIEWFLRQFGDVATLGRWTEQQGLLKLREVLGGKAQECARGDTQAAIVEALRLRFGVTRSDARRRLAVLKRDPRDSLHDHASEVRRLTRIASDGLAGAALEEAVCENFNSSIGNLGLQRHLMVTRADTLEGYVRAADEYMRAAPQPIRGERVQAVSPEEGVTELAVPTEPTDSVAVTTDPTTSLLEAMRRLEERMGRIETGSRPSRGRGGQFRGTGRGGSRPGRRGACFACGEMGHFAAACPQVPRADPEQPSN